MGVLLGYKKYKPYFISLRQDLTHQGLKDLEFGRGEVDMVFKSSAYLNPILGGFSKVASLLGGSGYRFRV